MKFTKLTGSPPPIFREEPEKKRFPWGKVIYLTILGAIFLAILSWGWTQLTYIEAPGLVQAPTFLVQSTETGRIDAIMVNIGDQVDPSMELARVNVTKRGQDQWNPEMIFRITESMENLAGQKQVAARELSLKRGLAANLAAERTRSRRLFEQQVLKYSDYKKIDLDYLSLQAEVGRLQALIKVLGREQDILAEIYRQYQPPEGLVFAGIRTPAAGLVINRERQPGDVVLAGEAILTLIDPQTLFIKAFIEEKYLLNISLGEEATVIFKDGSRYHGKVTKLYPASDSLPPEYQKYYMTRQKAIVAEIALDHLDPQTMKYGLTVRVRFPRNILRSLF